MQGTRLRAVSLLGAAGSKGPVLGEAQSYKVFTAAFTSWTARRPLSVLGSNAVPYVISNFEYEGQVPVDAFVATDDYLTGNFGQQRLPQPQPRINELPLSLLRG